MWLGENVSQQCSGDPELEANSGEQQGWCFCFGGNKETGDPAELSDRLGVKQWA